MQYSEHLVASDCGTFNGNFVLSLQSSLLFVCHVLGDWDREEVLLAVSIGDCLHVDCLDKFHLVHESLEGVGPTFRDCLEVLELVEVNVNE